MTEDIKSVIQDCKIVNGLIGTKMTELEYIYMLGYIQGKIDDREQVLKELNACH